MSSPSDVGLRHSALKPVALMIGAHRSMSAFLSGLVRTSYRERTNSNTSLFENRDAAERQWHFE
jgi:hypothetical protein